MTLLLVDCVLIVLLLIMKLKGYLLVLTMNYLVLLVMKMKYLFLKRQSVLVGNLK